MRIVVLFNLKPGASADAYENWARSTDIPAVRAMNSVTDFQALKATSLLGSDGAVPYQYIETIDITAMDPFMADVSTETAQRIADEFQEFADNPTFILTERL
ncbi:MAG: REDY-like protein HapK [Erythrobacter sp.]